MSKTVIVGLILIALVGCSARQSEGVFLTNAVLITRGLSVSEADARSRVNRDAQSH